MWKWTFRLIELHEGHAGALKLYVAAERVDLARTATVRDEDRPDERVEHGPDQSSVVGQPVAKRVGQAEYPLADAFVWEHLGRQMLGDLVHAAATARAADAAPLAGERNDALFFASGAAKLDEPVSRVAT